MSFNEKEKMFEMMAGTCHIKRDENSHTTQVTCPSANFKVTAERIQIELKQKQNAKLDSTVLTVSESDGTKIVVEHDVNKCDNSVSKVHISKPKSNDYVAQNGLVGIHEMVCVENTGIFVSLKDIIRLKKMASEIQRLDQTLKKEVYKLD
jgi:hypothetical protein